MLCILAPGSGCHISRASLQLHRQDRCQSRLGRLRHRWWHPVLEQREARFASRATSHHTERPLPCVCCFSSGHHLGNHFGTLCVDVSEALRASTPSWRLMRCAGPGSCHVVSGPGLFGRRPWQGLAVCPASNVCRACTCQPAQIDHGFTGFLRLLQALRLCQFVLHGELHSAVSNGADCLRQGVSRRTSPFRSAVRLKFLLEPASANSPRTKESRCVASCRAQNGEETS